MSSVEEALNQLYSQKEATLTLVGTGDISFNSSTTALNEIPATLQELEKTYLTLENNTFTIKQSGYYFLMCAVGSNMNRVASTSNSGWLVVRVNGETVLFAGQSYDVYKVNFVVVKLNEGDTIYGNYQADGGNFAKRAEYKIFYIC